MCIPRPHSALGPTALVTEAAKEAVRNVREGMPSHGPFFFSFTFWGRQAAEHPTRTIQFEDPATPTRLSGL